MYKEVLEKYGSQRKAAKSLNLTRAQFLYQLRKEQHLCRTFNCSKLALEAKSRCEFHLNLEKNRKYVKPFFLKKNFDYSQLNNLERLDFESVVNLLGSLKMAAWVLGITKYALKRQMQKKASTMQNNQS